MDQDDSLLSMHQSEVGHTSTHGNPTEFAIPQVLLFLKLYRTTITPLRFTLIQVGIPKVRSC
jgi:hypothetical protein